MQTNFLQGLHSLYKLTAAGVCTLFNDGLLSPKIFMYEIRHIFKNEPSPPPFMVA